MTVADGIDRFVLKAVSSLPQRPKEDEMDNEASMRRAYDLINAGDLEGFAGLLSDDFVEHEATPGLEPTKEGVLQFFTMYRAAFPDLRFEPEQFFVNDDKVAVYFRVTGTQSGEFMGIPATGKSIDVHGVDIVRFGDDGVGREHWGVFDTMTMMQQLGVVPEGASA
jgi:steroid delta-isomerase-like uncharacterized protein